MKIETLDAPIRPDLRRRRLLLGVPGGLIAASPLALVACGGGGDSTGTESASGADDPDRAAVAAVVARLPAVTRTSQAVTVSLPSGSGVGFSSTKVVSATSVASVGSDGASSIVQIGGAPQMGCVVDATGRTLLLGIVEAGKRTAFDSRGTAEALLLIASEAAVQGPVVELATRRALALPSADAVVEPVRVAVEAAASRMGIDPGDTQLMAALASSVKAMRAKASTAGKPAFGAKAGPLRAITPVPDAPQSGVSIENAGDFNSAQLKNAYRRRTHAWVSRTGYVDDTGNRVTLTAPVPTVDFDLSATTPLSFDNFVIAVGDILAELGESIGFLGDYEAGNVFFQPVSSSPFALAVEPAATAKVAIYKTRVVGVGKNAGGTLTVDESKVLDRLWSETFWQDIALPFMKTFILPLVSEGLGSTYAAEFQKVTSEILLNATIDLTNIEVSNTYFPATIAALKAGDANAMLTAFWTEFSTSNTWLKLLEIGMRGTVAAGAGGNAALGALEIKDLTQAFAKLARVVAVLRATATLGDYGAMAKDWRSSSRLAEFDVNVSKAKVALSPAPLVAIAFAGAAGKATVTAQVGDLDGTFPPENIFLQWTCTGKYGHLYKLGFDDTDSFESTLASPSHSYIPGSVEPDLFHPDTVKVTAFYRNPTTAARVEMGSATTFVQFKQEFNLTISPTMADVAADQDTYLTAFVQETLPSGATVEWTWSNGGVGSLADAPPDTNLQDSAVVFHAGSAEGAATVTASAVVKLPAVGTSPARSVTVKPKTAKLKVKKGLKTVTLQGSWTFDFFFGSYTCAQCGPNGTPKEVTSYTGGAWAVVPKVSGWTSCSVDIKGSDPFVTGIRTFRPSDVAVIRAPEPNKQDRGGAIWIGMSGGSGSVGDDGSGPPGLRDYLGRRFADLVITATYTLAA